MRKTFYNNKILTAVQSSVEKNRILIPIKTGNLRYKATQVRESSGGRNIKIVIDQQLAPYADYVNTKGKSAGYWENFYIAVASDLASNFGYKVRSHEATFK